MFNKVGRFFNRQAIKVALVCLVAAAIFFVFYFWRLGNLVPGLSPREVINREASSSISRILDNPVGAPQKILEFLVQQTPYNSPFWLRLPSAVFAVVFLLCFYFIVKSWFGKLIAVYTTLIFSSLPIVVILARNATPDILFLFPVAVLAGYVWLTKTERKDLAFSVFLIIIALGLYVPGMFWVALLSLIVWFRRLGEEVSETSISKNVIGFTAAFILLAPLVFSIVKDIDILKTLLFIPSSFSNLTELLSSIGWSFLTLVWKARDFNNLIIAKLSILNATYLVLSLFGIYVMWTKARRELVGLLVLIVIGIKGSGISHNLPAIALALPAIAILAAAGLRYLYGEWKTVFPLNPLPRALAIVLITTLVFLNLFIGARYSLIAWPRSVPTQETYMLK